MRKFAAVLLLSLLVTTGSGCIDLFNDPIGPDTNGSYVIDIDRILPELLGYLSEKYEAQSQSAWVEALAQRGHDRPSGSVRAQVLESAPLIHATDLHRIGVRGQGTSVLVFDIHSLPITDGAVVSHGEIVSEIVWAVAPETTVYQLDIRDIAEFLDARHPTLVEALHRYDPTDVETVRVAIGLGLGVALAINDEIDVPLAAVNVSMGTGSKTGGLFAQPCSGLSANRWIDAFLQSLVDENVLVIASAGNEGRQGGYGRESWPACEPNVVSVAATWDTSSLPFDSGCDTIAIDTLTCYSNRASFTDLAAPGSRVSTVSTMYQFMSDSTMALLIQDGTSWAAPHATGATALLQSGLGPLSANAIYRALRTTGRSVFDPTTGVTIPRLDVASAFVQLRGY